MRHRRTARALGTALLAPLLALGLAPGAGATLSTVDTSTTSDPIATTLSSDGTGLLSDPIAPSADETAPSVNAASVALPSTSDILAVNPGPLVATLDSVLDGLSPTISAQVCPAADMSTATCDQAYALVRAASLCLSPFVSGTRAACGDVVTATTALLNRIAAEATACASGQNAICATASSTALGATQAMLACLGQELVLTAGTPSSPVIAGMTNVDLYATCRTVVDAGIAVAERAVAAATACANGSDQTCADVVATVVSAANATLRCLDANVQVPAVMGGSSLLTLDLITACHQAVTTAEDVLALVVAAAVDCTQNPDGTCQQALTNARSVAAQITAEATDASTQAARCLTGEGTATGEVVTACQAVQDRIAGALSDAVALKVTLDSVLDGLSPTLSAQVCPAADMSTATCDQAYAVVRAVSLCLSPFLSGTRAGCGDVVTAATALLNRIAAEATACANGQNNICATATSTAIGATEAMLACLGQELVLTPGTPSSPVIAGMATVDLYATCHTVVDAAIDLSQKAVAGATACAEGDNKLCADVVTTIVSITNATLRCLGANVQVPAVMDGSSLLTLDFVTACQQAVQAGKDAVALVIAAATDCALNPDGTCQRALESAGSVAAQIAAEATSAATQAARCLTGEGTATGEVVNACDELQDRIAAVTYYTGEGPVEVGVAKGEADIAISTTLTASLAFSLDPTTLPQVESAMKTNTVTDSTGAVLSNTRETVEATAARMDGSGCVLNGDELKKRAIQAHKPITYSPGDRGVDIQYTFHPYQSNWARPLVSVGWTWQVEICSVGGAQTFNGFRLRRVGSGHTFTEIYQSLIDSEWRSGRDLPTVQADLYAHVGSENDPVQVGGSVSQSANGVNGGSAGTRMPDSVPQYDQFKHNGALSRWDTVCTWYSNPMVCGSRSYQGTVVHTLHEWPRTDTQTKHAVLAVHMKRACTTKSGKCET